MEEQNEILREVTDGEYKYGFVTDIETEMLPKGLNEAIVRSISVKKGEPEWDDRFPDQGLPPLEDSFHAPLAPFGSSGDRFSGHYLLRGPEAKTQTLQYG